MGNNTSPPPSEAAPAYDELFRNRIPLSGVGLLLFFATKRYPPNTNYPLLMYLKDYNGALINLLTNPCSIPPFHREMMRM